MVDENCDSTTHAYDQFDGTDCGTCDGGKMISGSVKMIFEAKASKSTFMGQSRYRVIAFLCYLAFVIVHGLSPLFL